MTRKVLMLCDSLGSGGAERQLALLASSLPSPWEASVFSLGGGRYADEIRALGVPLVVANRRFRLDPSPSLQLWRAIASGKPDVIHSWGWMTCWAAEPWCRLRGVPHVAGVIRRGAVYSARGRFPRLASRLGSLALANSKAGLTAFGVPDSRGRVLYNGIADERLARAPRPCPKAEEFHVVMAATMDDRKDFPSLIGAIRQLRDELPYPVRATLLGDGPCRVAWREASADLEAGGVMRFPGRVDEVLDHLADAHAGVLLAVPGWGEGISNSIMEYMAASLPVIATDSGGNPELVVPGETGLLVAAGDGAGIVAALRQLAGSRDQAAAMGAAGRRRVEEVFSVSAMVRQAQAIYEEAIALKRR